MRLAFIDVVFSWPPLGGAPADLYYTMSGLQALGHDVHLFYAVLSSNGAKDPVDESALPFEATRLSFAWREMDATNTPRRFREAVDHWKPDVVFQCFSFFLKPLITEALAHYPQVARYYAYEPFCPRDYRLFKDYETCPNNYLRTPNVCRRCAAKAMWRSMRTGHPDAYVLEYQLTRAYSPAYYKRLMATLRDYRAIVVYNHFTKGLLAGVNDRVHVIGGGVNLEDFQHVPLASKRAKDKAIILMTGRAEDDSKGIKTLQAAGEILAKERKDFEIWATHPEEHRETEVFKPIGWHPFSEIKEFYKQSDICVAPSIWEEPFGLVAVEAMATGRPVVAADVGGLQEIVLHGETGFVFPRNNAEELAAHLRTLLDNPQRCRDMGEAGRRRVEECYQWDAVISGNYEQLLEEVGP